MGVIQIIKDYLSNNSGSQQDIINKESIPSELDIKNYLKGLDYEEFKKVISKEISEINLEDFKKSGLNIEDSIKEYFELMKSDLPFMDINELLMINKGHYYTKETEINKGFYSLKGELLDSFTETEINNMERYNVNIDKTVNDYIDYLKDNESTFKPIVEFFEPEKEKINERFSKEVFAEFVDYEDRIEQEHDKMFIKDGVDFFGMLEKDFHFAKEEGNQYDDKEVYVTKEYKSVYEYPDNYVLINKFEIKEPEVLEKVERTLTALRISELDIKPIVGNFDFRHLSKIHKHIFKDVYDWAGKPRVEEISKGNTNFAPSRFAVQGLEDTVFKNIRKDNYLKGLPVEKLSEKLAKYYGELNFAHPFREGNGRSQREFIKELSAKNGYKLEWDKIDKDKLLDATIEATNNLKYDKLSKLLENGMANKEPDKNMIKAFERSMDFER